MYEQGLEAEQELGGSSSWDLEHSVEVVIGKQQGSWTWSGAVVRESALPPADTAVPLGADGVFSFHLECLAAFVSSSVARSYTPCSLEGRAPFPHFHSPPLLLGQK